MSLLPQTLSAASKGDITTLIKLSHQVNLDRCYDKFGATPVHYSARTGRLECMKWLIQSAGLSGEKPAHNGATPVHDAAATGQLDCLQWLIEYGGCSAVVRDACGATPLHLAARFGYLNVVTWLVDFKQCNYLEKAQNGVTPVHLAAAKGSINCLKWLSQTHPSSVNERADNGTTPAYYAAQEGKLDCLQFLVMETDANIQLKANDGMMPIHAAAQMGNLDCLAWMIESAGISPNERDNDGATAMHFAAARGHINVLQWLLYHGCYVKTDDLGGTPLHDAAEHGQLGALKVLVASGMDIYIRDIDGLIPADLADDCGHTECAAFLRSPSEIRRVKSNAQQHLMSDSTRFTFKEVDKKINSRARSPKNEKHVFKKALSDDEEAEGENVRDNAELFSDLKSFDPLALKYVPQKKKNLHHIKLGHQIDEPDGSERTTAQPGQQSADPIGKVSIKRVEEKKNGHNIALKDNEEVKKKAEIPAWKRALLEKKENGRSASISAPQEKVSSIEEQKKDKFDALPAWKKKLILQKQLMSE